tara:strand:- start:490 stop:4359 length:3870 start_codon:yes stop_codon:yes gene_type:complete
MIITEEYDKIVEEFNNLKHINSQTENIYSNITYNTVNNVLDYNEIIEKKDDIILETIYDTYDEYLYIYNDIAKNIVFAVFEYEKLIIEMDFLYSAMMKANVDELLFEYNIISKNIIQLVLRFNEIVEFKDDIVDGDLTDLALNNLKTILINEIVDIYNYNIAQYEDLILRAISIKYKGPIIDEDLFNNLEQRILNIVLVYNTYIDEYIVVRENLKILHNIYTAVLNKVQPNLYTDGPIILPEKYDYLENKLINVVKHYNTTLDSYNLTLQYTIDLFNTAVYNFKNNIAELNYYIDNEILVYKIRLFSIYLNIFIKHFRIMSYDMKVIELKKIRQHYIRYLKDLKDLKKAYILSHLHPLLLCPIFLLSQPNDTIILKDNVVDFRNISLYYGAIAPDFIRFNVKVLTSNVRSNLLSTPDNNIVLFENTYDGTLYFYPDYRNTTYEIEIEAYSMLISQVKYRITLIENGFPEINPIYYENSTIKLGKINDNTFNINLRKYYDDSNILFIVESGYSIQSNLSYDDIYTYKTTYVDYCNIPIITDNIKITPYMVGYPIFFNEYSNTSVILDIISSPEETMNTFTIELFDRTPLIYDLTAINEWYINVTTESKISFEFISDTRENIKDPTIPIIIQELTVLKIYPDYRGESYSIRINIESSNDYALKNILELTLVEDDIPKPYRKTRNLLLDHLLLRDTNLTFNANNYFESGTTELLYFDYYISNIIDYVNDVEIDVLSYNAFEIINNNLVFRSDYRNIGYNLYVYAIDSIYNVKSEDLLVLNIREDKVLNELKPLLSFDELGNELIIINLLDHIRLPDGQELRYINGLRYSVEIDKNLRKSNKNMNNAIYITDGKLYINPDYRDDIYNVNILIESYEFILRDRMTFSFYVSEVIAPSPTLLNNNLQLQTGNYNKLTKTLNVNNLTIFEHNINLDIFFINEIEYSKNVYTILDDTDNDNTIVIKNNTLIIKPDVRGNVYTLSILCVDKLYGTYNESNLLNLNVTELEPIALDFESNMYNLSNIDLQIDLNKIFRSTITNDKLTYYISIESDHILRLNVFTFKNVYELDNNILKIYPDYRGINYRLNITAINIRYIKQPKIYYIDINEHVKMPITPTISFIDINMIRFNYDTSDILYNLDTLLKHYKYYSNYIIRLESDILKIEDYILISLDNLLISNFPYEYNFTVNIVLFDIITNKTIEDNLITIRFRNKIENVFLYTELTTISLVILDDNYKYETEGLNGINITNMVTITNNSVIITKPNVVLFQYDFVINIIHIELNIIVNQFFYKVFNTVV